MVTSISPFIPLEFLDLQRVWPRQFADSSTVGILDKTRRSGLLMRAHSGIG